MLIFAHVQKYMTHTYIPRWLREENVNDEKYSNNFFSSAYPVDFFKRTYKIE